MYTWHWLTDAQVQKKLEEFGLNKLPEKKPPTQLEIFLEQLKSPLVYILIAAAIVTFVMGDHEDSIIIWVAVVLNTVLGYYQESKAGSSLEALKKMLQATTKVIRNGIKQKIPTDQLVPGDIVLLKAGEKVPADGKVVDANRLFLMEAMLTGESIAIQKDTTEKTTLFMGTIVQWGQWAMEVEKTWAHTEMGKIAKNLQWEETMTPLQNQLAEFSKQLSILVLVILAVVFIIGILTGKWIVEIFTTAVALAVGAIPEGLLVALTAVLAIGMQRILKKKWLVKNLVSAETLGSVTVICSDKTGTLTQGNMQVVTTIWDNSLIAQQAILMNDEDNAVALSTAEWAEKELNKRTTLEERRVLDHIPFSSENKCVAWVIEKRGVDEDHIAIMNGAPDFVLEWCDLSKKQKDEIRASIDEYTSLWYRLVWYARKKVGKEMTKITIDDVHTWLEWVGIVWLSDPVRPDVKEALAKTKKAWIKLIVITGDFSKTAKHIMHQLGVDVEDDHIMTGKRLSEMSDAELGTWLENDSHIKLFARTKPEQKMRIVNELKSDGEVVAMMGDWVNDAPALKRADIGIVVNEATDVAKESADLILLDSSFSTIVWAIEEWRWMFDNIRKIILYLLSDAFVEIFAIIVALIVWAPLPVTAAMILWINLVSDGLPNLALTVDPKRKWIMDVPPRSPQEKIVAPWMKKLIFIVSLTWAIGWLLLFFIILHTTGDVVLAQSVCFVTFSINSLVYVFSIKTLTEPFWVANPFNNKWLLAAVAWWLALTIAPFVFNWLGTFLGVVAIGNRWYAAFGVAIVMVFLIEIFVSILHKRTGK